MGDAMNNEIQEVSETIISDKAAQLRVNTKVEAEMKRIEELSNQHASDNKDARGVIRKIMDENKQAAAEEVKALAKRGKAGLKKANSDLHTRLLAFKTDLTDATDKLYGETAAFNKETMGAIAGMHKKLGNEKAKVAAALDGAKKTFDSKLNSLTNAIVANAQSFERKLEGVTGVVYKWKSASATDRKAIEMERNMIVAKQNTAINRAISLGETKRQAVEAEANANIKTEQKALMNTIATAVENMADNVFAAVQGNRQKIADNYLSLKAYTATAADLIDDYLQKGKGRNLLSIGDVLETVAGQSHIKTKPEEGEGFGASKLPLIFSGKHVTVDNSISKINGLVSEYMRTVGQVKNRWRLGLGRYLIAKLEIAMQKSGALEVDKVEDKSGNYVFINAHSVGLSSKLSDFQGLAVRMTHYENALAKLTGKLTVKKSAGDVKMGPPEWQ